MFGFHLLIYFGELNYGEILSSVQFDKNKLNVVLIDDPQIVSFK